MSNCGLGNTFDKITNYSQYSIMAQLEENFKAYLDWGFLNIGGFVNCTGLSTTIDNTIDTQAKPSPSPLYKPGKVWETTHKDWVYETGVNFNGQQPVSISGISVNSIFLPSPTGSGIYGYALDYPNGGIIFNNPIPVSSKVYVNHSYRKCQVYKSSAINWWGQFKNAIYSDLPSEYMINTPAIVVECTNSANMKPYQMGDRSFFVDQDIFLYVFAKSAIERNNLADIIRLQKERSFSMYNINTVIANNKYPLNYNGSINPSGLNYYLLCNNLEYYYQNLFIKDVNLLGFETHSKELFWCIVRITAQTIQ